MTKTDQKNARALALELLEKVIGAKQFSNIVLDKALESCELSELDKRLTSALFYGVIERKLTLDYRISQLSSRPIEQIDAHTLCALRLGLYQLIYMDKIPAHAAINETVSLCTRRTSGFVNGILRAHTRAPQIEFPKKSEDLAQYLSIKHSVSYEICKRFAGIFGEQRADALLESFGAEKGTVIRTNTLRISREELVEKIEGAAALPLSPHAIRTSGAVRDIYGFNEGLFFVQDCASQICVEALGAKEGELVMDICACPGSKSFGAAINMKNNGSVLSFDLHQKKLSLITSGACRLGIDIIDVKEQDGRIPLPHLFGKADRVLCDVPCSGFGVLGKKPELRYKDPAESAGLPDIQLAILENACNYLKAGGTLIYSTCTLFPEENEENIKRFLSSHPEFSLVPFSVGDISAPLGHVTLTPDIHGTDGFFIAKLTRS